MPARRKTVLLTLLDLYREFSKSTCGCGMRHYVPYPHLNHTRFDYGG